MMVIIANAIEPKVRGLIRRYLFEIDVNVFIGHLNNELRKRFWYECVKLLNKDGRLIQIWSTSDVNGFDACQAGEGRWSITNVDGLLLSSELHAIPSS